MAQAQALLVAGLGFGDEGKGATVDALCRTTGAHTVIRYNGGAQAAHNVIAPDGRHHTFSQFGSGTFTGAKTFLSRGMLINPIFLLSEGKHLQSLGETDCYKRLSVDAHALVTNPYQVAANRIREMARDEEKGRHGSCGMGIGETMADFLRTIYGATQGLREPLPLTIRIRNLARQNAYGVSDLRDMLEQSRRYKLAELEFLHRVDCNMRDCKCSFSKEWDILQDDTMTDLILEKYQEFVELVTVIEDDSQVQAIFEKGTTIWEGAQGMLLDQDYGFHPFTTWTDITFANAMNLLQGYKGEIRRIGILRSYLTRHGAGPFPSEDPTLNHPEPHNGNGPWQQGFRQGHFDLPLARYALAAIGGVDEIALTHLDRIQDEQKICVGYDTKCPDWPLPSAAQMWGVREDLETRENWTRRISEFSPIYQTRRYTPEGFATEIEKLLGVNVGMLAYGPTANDRRNA